MKKLILILVVLLILGGGGAAAWWFFLRPPEEGAEPVVEEVPPPVLSQIQIGPFSISLIKDSQPKQEFTFILDIVFDDPTKQAWATEHLPELQDAIVTELHGLLPRKAVAQGGYNVDVIRDRLKKSLAKRYGDSRFYDLTIRNMQIRDL